jgi:FtsZ-interacting cell division protein ZipA
MPDATLIIVAVVIIAILIVAVWWYSMRQRSAKLQEKFGPEYGRTVAEKADTRKAEDELTDRQKRVSKLEIRPPHRSGHSWSLPARTKHGTSFSRTHSARLVPRIAAPRRGVQRF